MSVVVKNSAKERDNELLVAVARGRPAGARGTLLNYHRRLARFLSRFTPRYENVEEIINDTFMWFGNAPRIPLRVAGIDLDHRHRYRNGAQIRARQKNHTAARSLDEYPNRRGPHARHRVQDWLKHGLNQLPPNSV